eukprot:PhF_6_TR31786/c0_g1_i2/m.46813
MKIPLLLVVLVLCFVVNHVHGDSRVCRHCIGNGDFFCEHTNTCFSHLNTTEAFCNDILCPPEKSRCVTNQTGCPTVSSCEDCTLSNGVWCSVQSQCFHGSSAGSSSFASSSSFQCVCAKECVREFSSCPICGTSTSPIRCSASKMGILVISSLCVFAFVTAVVMTVR